MLLFMIIAKHEWTQSNAKQNNDKYSPPQIMGTPVVPTKSESDVYFVYNW